MSYFLSFLIFMFGASIASFIAVYVERGEDDRFFSKKNRSICTKCLRKLNYFELVPIFSFLFLQGKCRTCKTKIPAKLFVGELLLGTWFLFSYLYLQGESEYNIMLPLTMLFGTNLYLLAMQDYEKMEVGSRFMNSLLCLGLLSAVVNFLFAYPLYDFLTYFFYPILPVLPLWLIYFINKDWIGEGDPHIFTSIALFFGLQFAFTLLLYSVWIGAAIGIFYLRFIHKKFERGVPIPFVPIIFLSTLVILVSGYHVIQISDILLINEIFNW